MKYLANLIAMPLAGCLHEGSRKHSAQSEEGRYLFRKFLADELLALDTD